MKKYRYLSLITALLVLLLNSCHKDPEVNIEEFEITKETVTTGVTSASLKATYSFTGKINGIEVVVADNEQLTNADTYPAVLDGKSFTAELTDLKMAMTYYYCYSVDYGFAKPYKTEVKSFATKSEVPTVATLEVVDVTLSSFRVKCKVTADGGLEVTERGVCWNTYGEPSLDDDTMKHANGGLGPYTILLKNLDMATKYYVRAYAKNATGVGYGKVIEASTLAPVGPPVVATVEVSGVTPTGALCQCNVSSDGGAEVTERGACWGTNQNPTVDGSHASSGTGTGSYTVNLTGLTPNKAYYVRAYAKNSQGVSYGEAKRFTTLEGLPTVTTGSVTDVTDTSAKCSGNVTDQGASAVTERGVCWSTSTNPTISGSHQAASSGGTGSFTINISSLTSSTTYHVRAYAKNGQGTSYGSDVTFTTSAVKPTVTTAVVSNITQTTATGGGCVTSHGGATVTERGVCWSTNHNPTVSNSHASNGTGTGSFTVNMTGLVANTTYYVRAYAKNSAGTNYGGERSFTTGSNLPTVTTSAASNITSTSVKAGGNVTDQGASAVTERGVCWSTSANPTISGSHQAASSGGTGSFTVNITGLTSSTTYHVRAYAKNGQGTSYGSDVTFTTSAVKPTVTTASVSNVTQTTATGGGCVTSNGGATVTERGVCWSTNHNPTVSNSHATSGTGTGSYTVNMTGLTANTIYYVRAYAKNSAGTSYGSERSFTTASNLPTVTTSTPSNITSSSAKVGGNVTSQGASAVTERGVCWSTSANPTISGSHQAASSGGTGSFTVNISDLAFGTTYHVRAYAKNSFGTSYGSDVTFTTSAVAPTVTTASISNITHSSATGGGCVTSSGGASVTERGICWSTSHNPTISGSHAASGTGTGSYTVNMTGLTANTIYYVRAYAKNSAGTSYGSERSFTTKSTTPTVTTAYPTNVTTTLATAGGDVTDQGASAVTERGVCWGTSLNPTTSGSHQAAATSGTGAFTVSITGLSPGTFYYVRAYAKNSYGTSYGGTKTFRTLSSGGAFPTGAINGLFSVSDTQQVWFSKGNLQYKASTNTWRFAENQWDCVGDANSNISSTYSGWIDLFGWGTSGYNHGAVCYQPWSTSEANSDYFAYGSYNYNLFDQSGLADWGYNAISNGGNMTNSWRTLTLEEWKYVFNTRSTSSGIRYAKAKVNDINGVILVPDNWSSSSYSLSNTNQNYASFTSNVISANQWTDLEQHGAVFLPAASNRHGSSVFNVGTYGYYWSASCGNSNSSWLIYFCDPNLVVEYNGSRYYGRSVRLVAR